MDSTVCILYLYNEELLKINMFSIYISIFFSFSETKKREFVFICICCFTHVSYL